MSVFSERVLAWFDIHGRKHLPWQIDSNAYQTWVSEIMLQQTQVSTVIPYFNRFMASFPDVLSLANASVDDVLAHWAGLGYYSRARNLHKAAQMIRDNHQGVFPCAYEDIVALPGIGRSTAGAILSLAFEQRYAILDGNVRRVLCRHQMIDGLASQSGTQKKLWAQAISLLPDRQFGQYTQAMMDLGAMVCTRSRPRCDECPVYVDCQARIHSRIHDYPNKQPKKVLPERSTIMLIISDGKRLYLEKRPDKGIWGGLWSFPEVNTVCEIDAVLATMSLDEQHRQINEIYTHTFTHYRLHITPVKIQVKQLKTGFMPEEYKMLGVPKPVADLV